MDDVFVFLPFFLRINLENKILELARFESIHKSNIERLL